jgi:hypothetical protein
MVNKIISPRSLSKRKKYWLPGPNEKQALFTIHDSLPYKKEFKRYQIKVMK